MYNERITVAFLYIITKYGYPPNAEDTIKHLEEMKALGFSSVELEGIREKHLLKVYEIRNTIANKIKELSLEVPYFCTVLPKLASNDPKIINEQLILFEKGCEVASLFYAKGVLDNAPLPPYQFPKDVPVVRHYHEETLNSASFPKDLTWKKYWETLVGTIQTACEIADNYNLTYQLHPALGVLSSTADGFINLYNAVKRDNLKFNFDTANLFYFKENLQLSLRKLEGMYDYIHISDNNGDKVEHLEIGKGVINWEIFFETLDQVNYQGIFGLDIGGAESDVPDLDQAYKNSAAYLLTKF